MDKKLVYLMAELKVTSKVVRRDEQMDTLLVFVMVAVTVDLWERMY
jgi:hypothetical protein